MTIESVLAQTFKDYEFIIVDDGSTDETGQLLQPFRDRLIYIYQQNKKYSGARNTGIRVAKGEYIAFLDSDDVWCPEKLERQVTLMEQHPGVTLCHCQAAYIDPQGNPIQFWGKSLVGPDAPNVVIADRTRDLFWGTLATTSTVMVRHSTLDAVGLFDETHIHGEDWQLWVRLANQGLFAYIPKPLVRYRFYGWQKILSVEVLDAWLEDQLKTIKTAAALWKGDVNEREQLRKQATATIYARAALANFQQGRDAQGQARLGQAIATDPAWGQRERLVQLALDRAKLIEIETGSYEQALAFIHTFFSNLPSRVAHHAGAEKEAIGWLYIGGAFEQRERGNLAAVRRLLVQAVTQSPQCLCNRGVVSIALEAWLGRSVMNRIRQPERRVASSRCEQND
jgi:hypothetical protein